MRNTERVGLGEVEDVVRVTQDVLQSDQSNQRQASRVGWRPNLVGVLGGIVDAEARVQICKRRKVSLTNTCEQTIKYRNDQRDSACKA